MPSLFIAGNGFDLAHNIPSKYSDFRTFIVEHYPESLSFRDKMTTIESVLDASDRKLAAEALLHTMDNICGLDWHDFENALAYIDFDSKFPKPNHKENETDDEDRALMMKHMLYMNALSNIYVESVVNNWQLFFQDWIEGIERSIENQKHSPKNSLSRLFNQDDFHFLTFNYTKTLQLLYKAKNVTHIHNSSGENLVFGHGQDEASYGQDTELDLFLSSSSLDEMIQRFRKDTDSQIRKYSSFFRDLSDSIDKVYSYGFSYGDVDGVYMKKIVDKISPKAIWLFTNYESKDQISITEKKRKLRTYGFKGEFGIFEG